MKTIIGTCIKCGESILENENRCPKCLELMVYGKIKYDKNYTIRQAATGIALVVLVLVIFVFVFTQPIFPVERCTNVLGIKVNCHTEFVRLVQLIGK